MANILDETMRISSQLGNVSNIVGDVLDFDVGGLLGKPNKMSISALKNRAKGYAKSNRFMIVMPVPKTLGKFYSTTEVEMICSMLKDCILPARRMGTFDHRSKGTMRSLPNDVIYQPVPITFYVDRQLLVRRYFADWINTITTNDHMSFNYLEEYAIPIQIIHLDEKGKATHAIELLDAYPTGVSEVQLAADADNQIMQQNVIITYHKWREIDPVSMEDMTIGGILNDNFNGLGNYISGTGDLVSGGLGSLDSLFNSVKG